MSATAHAGSGCYSCHLEEGLWSLPAHKGKELFRMYPAQLLGRTTMDPGTRVSRDACMSCHEGGLPDVSKTRGLRIAHATCAAAPAKCDECHGATAHPQQVRWARVPVMDECISCHEDQNGPTECDSCHTGKLETERLKSGPWQVTHGANWQLTHGMGDLNTCATCHPSEKCVGCHKTQLPHPSDFINTHGKQALRTDAKCLDCHQSEKWCESCHGMPMPHADGFLQVHSKSAKTTRDPKCIKCHRQADCSACHVKHVHPGSTDGNLRGTLPVAGGDR